MVQIAIEEVKPESKKKTLERCNRKSLASSDRTVTDGYWCLLFFFTFTLWISCVCYAYYHRTPNSKIQSDNGTTTTTINKNEFVAFYFWGKIWLFDAVTCFSAHLDEHYKNSGVIVIWTNILISILLIVYSLSSMRNNNHFYTPLGTACLILIIFTLDERFFMIIPSTEPAIVAPRHEKLYLWLIPEAIFVVVWLTKEAYANDCRMKIIYETFNFRKQTFLLSGCVMIGYGIYCVLIVYTWDILDQLSCWDDPSQFYPIVAASCYIALTLFYYLLMVVSCAVDINMDYDYESEFDISVDDDNCDLIYIPSLARALVIIGRYHFGTACYHATLIFPRLQTMRVMNEAEFKKQTGFKERFYEAQWKLHNISLMSTAIGGTNHSESLRELLRHRLFTSNSLKLECFQGFNQIARSLTTLVLSTNSLMLITLWYYGLNDSRLSLAIWMYYLRLMIMFKMAMKVCDAMLDSTLLHLNTLVLTFDDQFTQFLFTDDDTSLRI